MSSHFNSNSEATLAEKTPVSADSDTRAIASSDKPSIDTDVIHVSVGSNTAVCVISDTPAIALSDTSAIALSDTSAIALSDTTAIALSDTPAIAFSDTTAIALSDTSAIALSDTSEIALSDTSAIGLSDISAIDAKDIHVSAVSDTPVNVASDTPVNVASDTPVNVASGTPVNVASDTLDIPPGSTQVNANALSCTQMISDSISTTLEDANITCWIPEGATLISDTNDDPVLEKANIFTGTPNASTAVKDADGVTKITGGQYVLPPEDKVEDNDGVTKNTLITQGFPRGASNIASNAKGSDDTPTECHNDTETISDLIGNKADNNHYGIHLKQEQNKELDNQAPTHADLNIITTLPKYPEYANSSTRNKSFQKSPKIFFEKHKVLNEAGFFYTDSLLSEPGVTGVTGPGKCSGVICFYCGLVLSDPSPEIWSLHAALAPNCPYVLLLKGREDVEDTSPHGSKEEEKDTKTVTSSHNNAASDIAVSLLVEEGQDLNKVLEAADQLKQEDTARKLKVENSLLRKIFICKSCQENPVQVVYLPCGHWTHCVECAVTEGLINNVCKTCRKQVTGLVRGILTKILPKTN